MQLWLKQFIALCEAEGYKVSNFHQQCVVIPIYSFISRLLNMLHIYNRTNCSETWGAMIISKLKSTVQLNNFIYSWIIHSSHNLECQLFGTFLSVQCSHKIQIFLKVRAKILMNGSLNLLDDAQLKLQDIISIIHRSFKQQQTKSIIINGVKSIIMSFKISDAKIQSCVFLQFLLSVEALIYAKENSQITLSHHLYQNMNNEQKNMINFSSNIHEQNGMCSKTSQLKSKFFTIQDRKFLPIQHKKMKNHQSTQQVQNSQFKNPENNRKTIYESQKSQHLQNDLLKTKRKPIFTDDPTMKLSKLVQNNRKFKQQFIKKNQFQRSFPNYENIDDEQQQKCAQSIPTIRHINTYMTKNNSVVEQPNEIHYIHDSMVRNQHKSRIYS